MMSEPRDDRAILESKYSLVIAVAKRARDIVNRREHATSSSRKPVSIALDEVTRGKIKIVIKADEPAAAEETAETQEAEPVL